MIYTQHYASPLGTLLLAADDGGLTGLWFEGAKYFAAGLSPEHAEAETPIHTLEEELEQIKTEMARDSVQNDYQRLQELCALIEEKQGLLDSAMERWLTLSEEMGNN